MSKSREDNTKDVYDTIGAKNNERLLLLASIKSFNRGVEKIREEFGIIPEKNQELGIFSTDLWFQANGQEKFNPAFRLPGSKNFQKAVAKLCKQYNVPEHFYNTYMQAVPLYVVSGLISAPTENWEYAYQTRTKGAVNFKFYSPLSQAELLEFQKVLGTYFESNPTTTQPGSLRGRRQFMRDWEMAMPLVNRDGQPKRVKQYEQGSYLAMVLKDKSLSKKKIAELERLHASSVIVAFDQPTASSIAKKKKVSTLAVRQAKRRLNILAKQLYGHTLEE